MTLYVKYKADSPGSVDDGTAPVPPTAAPWATPDIWLTDALGNTQTTATGDPAAYVGANNYVHVTVNSTVDADYDGVQAQAWVCDYTGGIGPATSRPSSFYAAGLKTTVPDPVSKSTPRVAKFTWKAQAGDDTTNGGHLCVGVNLYFEQAPGPDGAQVTSGLLDVFNNRHHAQRNITVLPASQHLKSLVLRLANGGAEPADFEARAWELDREDGIGAVEQELLLAQCFVDLADGDPRPPRVPADCQTEPLERAWLRGGGRLVLTGLPEPAEIRPAGHDARFTVRTNRHCEGGEGRGDGGVHLRGARDGDGDGGPGRGGGWGGGDHGGGWGGGRGGDGAGLTIRPGELSPVLVTLECDGDPGEVHTLDIVQQTDDGTVLGGARLVAMHVPDWWSC